MNLKKFLTLTAAAAFTAASLSAMDITFTKVSGKVEFLDGNEWIQAEEGDVIDQGTVVSTGYKSSAVLKSKASTIEIGPMTRITLEAASESGGKENTQLFLDSGTIQSEVESGNKFKVRSAVATASVRGTWFRETAGGLLVVMGGLVDYGAPESAVAEKNPVLDSGKAVNADQKSTPFTPAVEVGGTKGVPVYAGQVSIMNTLTDTASDPHAGKARKASLSSSGTTSYSSLDSVSSTGQTAAAPAPASGGQKASVVVSIEIED